MDPIVSSHTWLCRHFKGCTKKQTERGKKKQTNTDSELQNIRRWSRHFLAFYVCSYGYCDNSAKILPSHQKCWLIGPLFSLPCVFILDSTAPRPKLWMSDPPLRSLIPDWHPFLPVSQVFTDTALCANIDKERSSGHSGTASIMLQIRSPPIQRDPRTHIRTYIYIYIYIYLLISLVNRVFTNGPVDLGSIPGRLIPKSLKMVLDTSLLNTRQYKVRIKGKVEQSRERSSALPYTLV